LSYSRSIRVGEAVFAVFQVGELAMKFSDIIRKETELPQGISLDSDVNIPIYNAYVSLGEASIIIDPCDYEALCPIGHRWRRAGYVPPRPLIARLSEMDVTPEDITDVVLTHFHSDHCIGATVKTDDGRYVPAFPRAKYYLGSADWNLPSLQEELKSVPEAINSLGVLGGSGVLTLIDSPTDVVPGITILPTPGESPGHQIIRVTSDGATLYCIGDLFHQSMDVADPRIMSDWNDPEANLRSRTSFLAEASRDDILVYAGHMSLGRIRRTPAGYEWRELRT
jgi:glyoxylase-like metal-dependent hydrolase (beta-lactamase superfamily II)